MTAPVAFFIFNRPDLTAKSFQVIREARPAELFIVADGPRQDRPGEAELCQAARAVVDNIDWPCEVRRNYSSENLGCAKRVSSGIGWVLEQVDRTIILEDDCIADPSFFQFCEELLERYHADERVMMISGNNFQFGRVRGIGSYYFTAYPKIWGWATWRRAWRHMDYEMRQWRKLRDSDWLEDLVSDKWLAGHWRSCLDGVMDGRIDSWGYRWLFACLHTNGISIAPNVNLISNCGFGPDATHTTGKEVVGNLPTGPIKFPLKHPVGMSPDHQADVYEGRVLHLPPKRRLKMKVKRLLQSSLPWPDLEWKRSL